MEVLKFFLSSLISLLIFQSSNAFNFGIYLNETGQDVLVATNHGTFIGKRRDGFLNGDEFIKQVDWFLGVPYATPPRRFEKPIPPPKLDRSVDATRPGKACIQLNPLQSEIVQESEDCLYLNIYRPVSDNSELYPVMLFIHGGSYSRGSGSFYHGNKLAQLGVVVVTINYRLTFNGFLTAKHPSLKGNYGLYDQIEALKWVQNNILKFRGDPERVTIFGNSAGGSSVALLCLIPQAKGLFSQAIVQSGSPLAFWAFNEIEKFDQEKFVRRVGSNLSCDQESMSDVVNCLKKVDIEDLHSAITKLLPISPINTDFSPIIDHELLNDLPENNKNFYFRGPLMTGIVSNEMPVYYLGWIYFNQSLIYHGKTKPSLKDDGHVGDLRESTRSILKTHFANYTDEDVDKIFKKYLWPLPGQNSENIKKAEEFTNHINLLSDIFLGLPVLKLALMHRRSSDRPTFFYEFHHNASFQLVANCHEIELNFLFGHLISKMEQDDYVDFFTETDRVASLFLMKLWTNFAKYGEPSRNNITKIRRKWQPMTDASDYYIIAGTDDQSRMSKGFRAKEMKFWDEMKPLKLMYDNGSESSFQQRSLLVVFAFIAAMRFLM